MEKIDLLLHGEKYQNCRSWISNQSNNGQSWEEIRYARKNDIDGLRKFLSHKQEAEFWDINEDDWFLLVNELEKINNNGSPAFIGNPRKPQLSAPEPKSSCWQKYRKKLENDGFSFESIYNMEISATKIISQLSSETDQRHPVRGLVLGNVQSGKTANMVAVMAMAADYGYNFFIVLSGTIENLRQQTRDRLISNLNFSDSYLKFEALDDLSNKTKNPHRLQDLFLDEGNTNRYMTVCLKNSTRLRNLLNWINRDPKQKSKLKVLIIDDEADQAGVNTADISQDLKSTINKHISGLVFGKDSQQRDAVPYKCMNYIGYTATPYANFLNEANEKSLYPENFIMTLNSPGDYVGPQQIFGVPDINVGLPIVNEVYEDEINSFRTKDYIKPGLFPNSLKESLFWFICTIAIFRYWDLKKPVSMLIHTSQKIEKHFEMEKAINDFFASLVLNEDLFKEIGRLYQIQCKKLKLSIYKEELPSHGYVNQIKKYPKFEEILPEIKSLLSLGITHIMMNEEDDYSFSYSNGIHLCVDNCSSNQYSEDFMMRLIYPDKDDVESISNCPAFLVIGGSTLSRGLTIEGLTTTYFLRTTSTADTLMQMGRWFGYRKKYELLPRIWMSKRSIQLFQRLSKLDYDLREELHNMESMNLSPNQYGPRLDSFPDYKLLKITSSRKMQSAYEIKYSLANKSGQTIKFYNDEKIIEDNFKLTEKFINELGKEDKQKRAKLCNPISNEHESSHLWFDVDYHNVLDYLENLKFPPQIATINDYTYIKEWFSKQYSKGILKNWNVVVSGTKNGEEINFNHIILNLPSRRKIDDGESEFIKLGALTAQYDKLIDIDCSNFKDNKKELEKFKNGKGITIVNKRVKYGDNKRPLLVIYILDKDGGKNDVIDSESNRIPLNLNNHLVGYYLYIPYGAKEKGSDNIDKITVKLEFDVKGDLEDAED